MKKPLRLLHVEDNEDDAELILREVRRGGYEVDTLRVDTAAGLHTALTTAPWDVVIADYSMPSFSAPEALFLVRRLRPDLPFIVVSGTMGEDTAVEMMRNGADDYLMKDSLARLVPAIGHALQTATDRWERRRAEEALRQSLLDYETLYKAIPGGLLVIDASGRIVKANDSASRILQRSQEHLLGTPLVAAEHRIFGDDGSPLTPSDYPLNVTLTTGEPVREFVMGLQLGPSDEITWLLTNAEAILDPVTGTPTAAVVTFLDRTEHRQTHQALRESERRFREMAELMPDALYEIGPDLLLAYVNQAMCNMLGYSAAELLSPEARLPYTTPASRDDIGTQVAARLAGEVLDAGIRELVRKDGVTITVEMHADAITGPNGESVGVRGVMHDITARVQAAQGLAESEQRFREMAELMPDALYEIGPDLVLTYVNRAMCNMLGYSAAELLAPDALPRYTTPASREDIRTRVAARLAGEVLDVGVRELVRKDGEVISVEVHADAIAGPNGESVGVRGVMHDITARVQAARALEESERRFRDMAELMPDMLVECTPTGDLIYANRATRETLGYGEEPSSEIPASVLVFLNEETQQRVLARWAALADGAETGVGNYDVLHRDGHSIPVEAHAAAICDEDGQCTGFRIVLRDIARRLSAELALRESEARFRLIYEESPVPYQSLDENGCITDVNPRWLDALGYEREDVIGRSFADFLIPIERPRFADKFAMFKAAGTVSEVEWPMQRKDGATLIAAFEGRVARHPDGSFKQTHCVFQDVTEAQRLRSELLKTEKLESLGVLAGGIAHDFNNALLVIMGNLQMARLFPTTDEMHFRQLRNSESACEQARELTGQLLTFARGGAPVKKTACISGLVRDTALFAVSGSNVKCTLEAPDELPPVDVDPGQLSQVINNLVINADQAMPSGGTLRIRVDSTELDGTGGVPLPPGSYVRITVADEGVGIPRDAIERIFDPYFTTKSEGNGLGLANCFSIIHNHDGHIGVRSEEGVGTTFTIYLPCSTEPATDMAEAEEEIARGEGRILVMDDEEAVRDFTRMILEEVGYEVEVAREGQEAIASYEQALDEGRPFAAVVLDLTVRGGAGGKAAIEQLLRIDPNVRAVVCSGYSADPVMANYRDYGFRAVVVKPYGVAELANTLYQVIHEA